MMHTMLEWLENSSLASGIRQSNWSYPAIEIVHILGIIILVGPAFLFDLRLLGWARHLPISGLKKHLLTWSMRGLILIIPSGILLFMTNATTIGYDPVFWLKMALIGVGGINAFIFRQMKIDSPNAMGNMPLKVKAIAIVSMVVWICVVACGRLLAY